MSPGALSPEDAARANFYALLAHLFYSPPGAALLASLSAAQDIEAERRDSDLAIAWQELKAAARVADPEAVREEYEAAFVGTGKAEVTLYAGAYLPGSRTRNPLVEIRGFLDARGLERMRVSNEPEDHFAALCDVMRHLVADGDDAAQREFFEHFFWPAIGPLCDAIGRCGRVRFYGAVARFAHIFAALEHSAFEMD